MINWLRRSGVVARLGFAVLVVLLISLLYFMFFWRLGSLNPGLSPAEASAKQASLSISSILNDPIYGPHKLLQLASSKFLSQSSFGLRLPSVLLAMLVVSSFYLLVKSWFGRLIAILSSLFLVATPWFALTARSAGPEILLLLPLSVIYGYYWLHRRHSNWSLFFLCLSAAAVMYIPGGLYLLLIAAVVAHKQIMSELKACRNGPKIASGLLYVVLIAPLVYGLSRHPNLLKTLLFWPPFGHTPIDILKTIGWAVLSLFVRTPMHFSFGLGRLPMLTAAQIVLVVFGFLALIKLARPKLVLLVSLPVLAVLAAGFSSNYYFTFMAMPTLAVLLAAGLRFLYFEWRTIFPRNPIAHYFALVFIVLLVVLHVLYGVRYVLDGWPNSKETRASYMIK